jgi:hypothetical protein
MSTWHLIQLHACARTKLASKVVLDDCVRMCVYDVVDSYLLPCDAGSHTKVHFRSRALRPFIDEVCCARVRSNTRRRLYLTPKPLDDIFVDILAPAYSVCVHIVRLCTWVSVRTSICNDKTEQVWY